MNTKGYIQLLIICLITMIFIQCNSEQKTHKCGVGQIKISQDSVSAPILSPNQISISVDTVLEDNNSLPNSTAIDKDCTYTKYHNKI